MTLVLIAAVIAWFVSRRPATPSSGAGASADTRAQELRTPAVRLAEYLGIPTQRGRQADCWAAGAVGERATAGRLAPLSREGWLVMHDRALPGSRANLDHLLVSPNGVVVVPDTKRWSARWPVTIRDHRLHHGDRDVHERLRGLTHEAGTVARLLGVPVIPLILMDGPPIPAGRIRVGTIRIVPADQAVPVIRSLERGGTPHPDPAQLRTRVAALFLPYGSQP
jgi:nuclease-like protein